MNNDDTKRENDLELFFMDFQELSPSPKLLVETQHGPCQPLSNTSLGWKKRNKWDSVSKAADRQKKLHFKTHRDIHLCFFIIETYILGCPRRLLY